MTITEAAQVEEDRTLFDLNVHFDTALDSMFNEGLYGAYELQVLKTMAAFGESLAALFLVEAYAAGEFTDDHEPHPLEELRWSLIQKFLEGDNRWPFFACNNQFDHISAEDSDLIVNEVRAWIKENPIALSLARSVSEKGPRRHYYVKDGDTEI